MMLEQALTIVDIDRGPTPAGTGADTPGDVVVRGKLTVDENDPFLDGHYPGFPLVPGFGLVQYVHDLVTGVLGEPRHRPAVVERARFLSPVRPGDEVVVEARLARGEHGVRTDAEVTADGRPAARIRLRLPGAEPDHNPQEQSR
ncbi:3-hydroxyacyl-ACP dehydratase FabZ family protein [Streptomyces tendae]|uniref:3-hydroxyacyl-ACP dehydratase FabZ family protein n=1 Tax=Streptomyces tendae TaxID=1932 RepID=UPI003717B5FD